MTHRFFPLLFSILLSTICLAQEWQILSLPRQEQLSSQRILQVIQDSEGFLWYATEGGGLCRDDGRQMMVFRNDAEHPHLLGSNDIACVAVAGKYYIIIGTFHGAYVLDKRNYDIRHLKEVDDKRVDDIIVGKNGNWWLTANKKVYEYDAEGHFLHTFVGRDKYIFRLHEDRQGRLWGAEWEGGLLRCDGKGFVSVPWPVNVMPTSIRDNDTVSEGLLIGTFGRGVVSYDIGRGTVETTELGDSFSISRVSYDRQGRMLVADGRGNCYAMTKGKQKKWYGGRILTRFVADSMRSAYGLSSRPTALAESIDGGVWFSTGHDIRCKKGDKEEVVLPDTKDVSAMTFTKDKTLWLATIYGTLIAYRDGKLMTDDYASNEYGDAVLALQTDSLGRLLIVCERYVRIYDIVRHTLRQQNREEAGVYCVELEETIPDERWSQPKPRINDLLPVWLLWLLIVLLIISVVLSVYAFYLHRQRKRFLAVMTKEHTARKHDNKGNRPDLSDEWLKKAISVVEEHIADDGYGVEQLASDMYMSRMTFYRKLQSSTGQKPTEFIRTIRLHHAAELLREGHLSVTEVAYATGFSSVSYFSRCFRTMYGVPPTHFGKTTTAEDLSPSQIPDSDDVLL